MYNVHLYCKNEATNVHYNWTWNETFPTLKDAVRFGMRAYRKWDEVEYFRTSKVVKRPKYALHMW